MFLKAMVRAQVGAGELLRRRPLRAAGLLEYALIALLSVGVFAVLYSMFNTQISNLVADITGKIDECRGAKSCE